MTSQDQPHILVAAACFLGISLLLFTGLKMSGTAGQTSLDEITIVAMVLFLGSCALSYASLRRPQMEQLAETVAMIGFLTGLLVLAVGIVGYALDAL